MSYRKRGGGLLGLLVVAALGAMAFAGSTQAVVPKFSIGGVKALHSTATKTLEGISYIFFSPSKNATIKCTHILATILIFEDGTLDVVEEKWENCKATEYQSPFGELPCHVSDVAGGKPELLNITSSYTLLPVEFASGSYGMLAEGLTAQLNFLSGTGCPLPLKNTIKGEICFKITAGNDTTEPLIRSSQAIQSECPEVKLEGTGSVAKDKLLLGVSEAFIEGSATLKLTGGHAGKTLGVLLL